MASLPQRHVMPRVAASRPAAFDLLHLGQAGVELDALLELPQLRVRGFAEQSHGVLPLDDRAGMH